MEFIDVSSTTSHREPPEPDSLLEEFWFFRNLLIDSKSKISKSYSNIGPSSNYNTQEGMSVIRGERSSSATPMKGPKGDNFDLQKLARASSLPSYMEPKVEMFDQVKGKHDLHGSNCSPQINLIRKQSLPPYIRRQEDDEDEESEFTLGRLIRQASVNSSHILPPRHNSKAQSSSFPTKSCPRNRTGQLERNKMDMRDRHLSDETMISRSSNDVETKQVISFKTSSCVPDNCRDITKLKMTKTHSPTVPKWYDNDKRSPQDMKAEIKFWARAVATNVGTRSQLVADRN